MPLLIHCSSCNKPLKVRDELAGKKVKCPSCGVPVLVKAEEPMLLEEVIDEPVPAKPAKAAPAAIKTTKPEPAELEPVEAEENLTTTPSRPKRGRAERAEEKAKPRSLWVPCPKCGTEEPKRVKFTFWGSFYGPKLFNHVRCQECGSTYNGKTGGSNILPAIGCVMVPLFGIILILSGLGGFVYYRLVYEPAQEQQRQQQQNFTPPAKQPPVVPPVPRGVPGAGRPQ